MAKDFNSRNTPVLLRKPTPWYKKLMNVLSIGWMKLQEWPQPVRYALGLTLIMLALSLAGCATPSMPSSVQHKNPSPPPTTLSEQPQSYLESARNDISQWQKRLTELLPKP